MNKKKRVNDEIFYCLFILLLVMLYGFWIDYWCVWLFYLWAVYRGSYTGCNCIYHCFCYSYGYSFDFWCEEVNYYLYEEDARKLFRKWDNIKHKREYLVTKKGGKRQGKKKKENPLWGISIKTKERLNSKDGKSLKFGLVITLKEINGVNRIEQFIQQCLFKGWLVNRINVENKIDIYNKAEEEIIFE